MKSQKKFQDLLMIQILSKHPLGVPLNSVEFNKRTFFLIKDNNLELIALPLNTKQVWKYLSLEAISDQPESIWILL